MLATKRHRKKETQFFFMIIRKIEKALNSETARINNISIAKMFMKNVMTKLFFEYRDLNEAFNQSQVKELSSH